MLTTGIIAAYLLIGLLLTRKWSVRIYRRHLREWYGSVEKPFLFGSYFSHVLCWPFALLIYGVGPTTGFITRTFFLGPVEKHKRDIQEAKEAADFWHAEMSKAKTSYQMEMAQELYDLNKKKYNEMKLPTSRYPYD